METSPLPLYAISALLADGKRAAVRHSIALAVVGSLLTGASLLIFGAGPMLFNTLSVPGNQPWKESGGLVALARRR